MTTSTMVHYEIIILIKHYCICDIQLQISVVQNIESHQFYEIYDIALETKWLCLILTLD